MSSRPTRAREQALVERLLAERRRHLGLGDQLQVDRQRADAQALRQVLRLLDRADAVDLRAGAAVDALRVLAEVDRGERDDLVVERDREALQRGVAVGARRQDDLRAALGDPLGDPREGLAALVGELHRDDGLLGLLVDVLLGVLDVGARQLRVVLEHEVALHRLGLVGRPLGLDHHDALRHLEHLALAGGPLRKGGSGSASARRPCRPGSSPARSAHSLPLGTSSARARRAADRLEVGQQLLAARGRAR